MTEQPTPPDEATRLAARLATLRSQGAWRLDPARFHTLEALSRRLPVQQPAVRALLQDKLQAGLDAYTQRLTHTPRPAAKAKPGAAPSPLAQLTQHLREAVTQGMDAATPGDAHARDELASMRRFRRTWSQSRAQDQVVQAVARKPANAGPLNSHVLVLRTLDLMQALSPEYLRRFVAQVESLQWLEQASEKYPRTQAKQSANAMAPQPARKPRAKK
jgi:hypothetical protein